MSEQPDKRRETLLIRERDILFCESLIACLGRGVIDTYQMADILGEFNRRRPDKPKEDKNGKPS
jgi:hypothetical protein